MQNPIDFIILYYFLVSKNEDQISIDNARAKAMELFQDAIADAYSTGWHDGQDVIINQIKHVDKGGDELGIKHFKKHFK